MAKDRRIIDGYTELYAVRLDGIEEIVAENLAAKDQYRIYTFTQKNPLIAEYYIAFAGTDYLEVMREFIRRLGTRLDALDLDRVYRGSQLTDAPLLPADCAPGGMDADLAGKVVAIKQDSLAPEFRAASHQLHLAAGGFGCSPDARGRAVYCTDLYSGKQVRWDRSDILGVIAEDTLPEWAREKLVSLRDPACRESALAKLREGKKAAADQPRRKKERTNNEPEH
jgi:hypothetical protein